MAVGDVVVWEKAGCAAVAGDREDCEVRYRIAVTMR